MGQGLIKRRLPLVGEGNALLASIHVDDAASAFVAASTKESKQGLWHVTDDNPITVKELLYGFAEKLRVPKPFHILL